MALIRNGSNQLSGLNRMFGAVGASGLRSVFDCGGVKKNFDSGSHAVSGVTNKAGLPSGMRHPMSWKMGTKSGAMVSANDITTTFTLAASGSKGLNGLVSIPMDFTMPTPQMGLVTNGIVSIPMEFTMPTPTARGALLGAANFTGMSWTLTPVLGAKTGLSTTIPMTFTLTPSIRADAYLSANITNEGAAVTPTSVAAEVWNTVAAAFNVAGSMGNKMNSAASAGDPWGTPLPGSYLAGTAGQILGSLENDLGLEIAASVSGLNLTELKFAIESLRPHHTAYGTAYYWSPVDGDDLNDGLTPATACKTFSYIHDVLVTDFGHDIIYCLPKSSGGGVTTGEKITVSKSYTFVRGPGRDFEIDSTLTGGAAVTITGDGAQLQGVRVKTSSSTTDDAITITGDFAHLLNVWCDSCGGDAISISSSSNSIVEGGYYRSYKGHGVNVGSSTNHLWLYNVGFHGTSGNGDAVHIDGTSIFEVKLIGRCDIHANSGWGVNVVSSGTRTSISADVLFEGNTLGDVFDWDGTRVIYEGRVNQEQSLAPSVLDAATAAPISANVKQLNDATLIGTGVDGDKWRG
jgi:hypothetical protein